MFRDPTLVCTCFALALASFACSSHRGGDEGRPLPGSDGAIPPGSDGGRLPSRDAGPTAPGEYGTCCIDDALYSCPSADAFDACAGHFDVDSCISGCSPSDFGCVDDCFSMLDAALMSADPSGCARQPTRDGECATATCSESSAAPACELDGDCVSDNCFNGHCYANTEGSPCDLDGDCQSDNCFQNCCQSRDVGAGCDLDGDCDSDNCYANRCEGRGFGSNCDLDGDCDSGNCTDNVCR